MEHANSRLDPTLEDWENIELADIASVLRWASREHLDELLAVVAELPGVEELPLRKTALFGWVWVVGNRRPRPNGDMALVVPIKRGQS